jgi:hypothetical protein
MKFLLVVFLLTTPCLAQGDTIKSSNPIPKSAIQRREDWKSLGLTAGLASAELFDGISTKKFINDCLKAGFQSYCAEGDPASRLILGNHPGWLPSKRSPGMIIGGTVEAFGAHYVAKWMRQSPNRWLRRFWWAPQVGLIGVHLSQGVGNFSEAAAYRRLR